MDGRIIRLSVIDSTNIYTTKLLGQSDIPPWTVVMAESQTAGKGQRGKSWESEYGKNLLCSVFLQPKRLNAKEQFRISVAVSLAVIATLRDFGVHASIKWPNDILVEGQKIAGILIENQIGGDQIESSIVGLGLNVNQLQFNSYMWPAVSMINLIGGPSLSVDEVLTIYIRHLKEYIDALDTEKIKQHRLYNEVLWNRGKEVDFEFNVQHYHGVVRGVSLFGELVIATAAGEMRFMNGEIRKIRTYS